MPRGIRHAVALALAVGTSAMFALEAQAQTGNNSTQGNTAQGTGTNAGAAEAGSTLNSGTVFSSTSDTVGNIGANDGRFTTSRLSTQPTAGGNTNATQQNAFDNARNLQRLNQQFGRSNQNRNAGNTQGTRTIRPSLRLGFTPKLRPAEDIRKSFGKQVKLLTDRLPQLTNGRSDYASVKFDLAKPGEVVLSGSVPNDDAGRLLTNILRMEPGVSSVRNNLKVSSVAGPPAPANE